MSLMWPDASETQDLLKHAGSGASSAVNRLLMRHRRALRRLVGGRLDPALAGRVDASDVVQEAMLVAAQRFSRYLENPAMPFHLWLRQLALDAIIDAHRRHRVAKRRSIDREAKRGAGEFAGQSSLNLASRFVDHRTTPVARALRRELQARFETAVSRLAEGDREILLMRHLEQLGNQDVARALSLSEPAAGMRYLRALKRLRAILRDDGQETSGS